MSTLENEDHCSSESCLNHKIKEVGNFLQKRYQTLGLLRFTIWLAEHGNPKKGAPMMGESLLKFIQGRKGRPK